MLFENWISQILVQKEVLGLPTHLVMNVEGSRWFSS